MEEPSVRIFVDTDLSSGIESIEMSTKSFSNRATLAENRIGRTSDISINRKRLELIAKAFKALSNTDNFAGFVFLSDVNANDIKTAIDFSKGFDDIIKSAINDSKESIDDTESEPVIKNFMPEFEVDNLIKYLRMVRLNIFKRFPMYRSQLWKDGKKIAESETMIPASDFDFLKEAIEGKYIVTKLSDSRYPNMYIKFIRVKYYNATNIGCIGSVIMDLITQSHKVENSKECMTKVDVEKEDEQYLLEKITDDIVKEEERDDEDDCLSCY